jgi:DNA-binding IclR family transcriptional regulator
VLEQFGRQRRPLRAIELVNALHIAPSSIDQLLKSLTASGYLIFDFASKVYAPSPRLDGFVSWFSGTCFGEVDLAKLLQTMHEATNELATVTVQNDCSMQIVSYVGSPEWDHETMFAKRFPVIGTVSGGARLASCTDREIATLAHRARYIAANKLTGDEVLAQVNQVRKLGYAAGDTRHYGLPPEAVKYDSTSWAIAIGMPRAKTGGIPMVLGIGGPQSRLESNERHLVREMQQAMRCVLEGSSARSH